MTGRRTTGGKAAIPLILFCAGATILACSADPAFLGVGASAETQQPPDPDADPFSCEDSLCFIDPGLTRDKVQALFDEAEWIEPPLTQPAPTWIYPLEGSVLPNNLALLSLHFVRSSNLQEVFELSIEDGEEIRKIYFPCLSTGGNGCTYRVPEDFWSDIARHFAGRTVTLTLRGARDGSLSETADLPVTFSPEPVRGGLYYWSSELRGVYRLLFGGRQAVKYVAPGTEANPDACAGCHAMSRDGSTIAYTLGSADPDEDIYQNAAFAGSLKVARVTGLTNPLIDPSDVPIDSGMMTLSRTGDKVVSAFDLRLELRETASGALLDEISELNGKVPFFPEFSPDDSAIVVTLTDAWDSEIAVRGGGIYRVSVDGNTFGTVTELVPDSPELSHYYPSWSPDGKWVAFVSSPSMIKSYDQAQSRLQVVSVETGRIFELAGASGPLNSTSTWPKFAPFSQCPSGRNDCPDDPIFFLSYSSKRPYGLIANQPGSVVRSQLWMSALYMGKTADGLDPSSPPFWVPYQDPDTSNHLGYWTLVVRCNDTYGCGAGQLCAANGECIVRPR